MRFIDYIGVKWMMKEQKCGTKLLPKVAGNCHVYAICDAGGEYRHIFCFYCESFVEGFSNINQRICNTNTNLKNMGL